MDLKVIEGGMPKNVMSEDQAKEKLLIFIQHLRTIENHISMVNRISQSIKWDELSNRTNEAHKKILDTLGYVKRTQKEIIGNMVRNKPDLHIIENCEEVNDDKK